MRYFEIGKTNDGGETWAFADTIYGAAGNSDPYMTRLVIGRLRLHIFHRGDNDPDPHDHPWDFWTFPLTSYVEEVIVNAPEDERRLQAMVGDVPEDAHELIRYTYGLDGRTTFRNVVRAWRWSFRPAEHTHRVLGRWSGIMNYVMPPERVACGWLYESGERIPCRWKDRPRKIVTIVWRGPRKRTWGFLKKRDGRWCWQHWKEYVYGGGKHAPCEDW